MNLTNCNNTIRSREDFVAFARALSADLRDNPETWQNGSLERFLEALAACAENVVGECPKPVPQKPEWKVLADMLMAAKVFEQMEEMACV
ncbi:MAG TPA: hypothetical protein VH280_24615 [Verrucomicrobiae bacterium]|jgi:hypothetical protein|nr:hypothetical protein [Verrucomicrobiae bacterium]